MALKYFESIHWLVLLMVASPGSTPLIFNNNFNKTPLLVPLAPSILGKLPIMMPNSLHSYFYSLLYHQNLITNRHCWGSSIVFIMHPYFAFLKKYFQSWKYFAFSHPHDDGNSFTLNWSSLKENQLFLNFIFLSQTIYRTQV